MVLAEGTRSRDSEEGAVAVLVGILAVVLFGLAALVVNLGLARDTRREAQNTADAAALAAANNLYLSGPADTTAAINAAKQSAADNYGTTTSEWASFPDPTPPPLPRPAPPARLQRERGADRVRLLRRAAQPERGARRRPVA